MDILFTGEAFGIPIWPVILFFFSIAFLYSSVGLGGGSSYTALLTILGVGYVAIPSVSLTLNLIVSSAAVFNYSREGYAKPGLFLPFLVTSVPLAYVGGAVPVSEQVFIWVLFVTLILIAARIYFWSEIRLNLSFPDSVTKTLPYLLGAILGFLAGLAGIGGGIFLVPFILLFGLADMKSAAATGAIFIFVNSLSGLVARVHYQGIDFSAYLPIMGAVLAGGIIGSMLGAVKFTPATMQKYLGIVILLAILLLGRRLLGI